MDTYHLTGTYNTIKATMDHLKKTRGSYLHVSATLQYTGIPWQSAASSAKAGVDALSQVLAVEMGPLGVRSNVVAPGMIGGTEGADRLSMKGAQDAIASTLPLQKVGKPSDIANICVYLFSEAGNWITGSKFVSLWSHLSLIRSQLYQKSILGSDPSSSLFIFTLLQVVDGGGQVGIQ